MDFDGPPDDLLIVGLRQEHATIELERIPGLWWQKFLVVGATAASIVTSERLPPSDTTVAAVAVALPLIAVLIDAKTAEYALTMRSIADHVAANDQWPSHAAWYRRHWEGAEARLRSLLALVGSVGTTSAIALAGAWSATTMVSDPELASRVALLDLIVAGGTVLAGVGSAFRFFRPLPEPD